MENHYPDSGLYNSSVHRPRKNIHCKEFTALFLFIALSGCASPLYQRYSTIYDSCINLGEVTTIVKKESYKEIKDKIADAVSLYGYNRVIFESPHQGFIVLARENADHLSAIILKYKAIDGDYKTSIELVRGSEDVTTDIQVLDDIQKIAARIKSGY